MKTATLSLLAAAVLACAACKNNAQPATTADAQPAAPAATSPAAQTSTATTAETATPTTAAGEAPTSAATASATASGHWSYQENAESDGVKRTASVEGRNSEGGSARLVFSDHSVWGRKAYIEFAQGGAECATGCKTQISIDGAPAKTVLTSPAETAQPTLVLDEPRELWRSIANAKTLSVEFPTQSGGTGKLEFDIAGIDATKLPGWN